MIAPAVAPAAGPEPAVIAVTPQQPPANTKEPRKKNGLRESGVSVIPPPADNNELPEMQLVERENASITLIPPANLSAGEEEEVEEEVEDRLRREHAAPDA